MKRTHNNGELNLNHVDEKVSLIGWVSKRRNLGSICFIDLRDRYGITQVTFNEDLAESIKDVRSEYILEVEGVVKAKEVANPKLKTGQIEVLAQSVKIINKAETTPIIIADQSDALEDTRLKYRYLDLRRAPLQANLMLRHQVALITRNFLSEKGFIEIETPILCKSTPEGARDYLIPSRISKGQFYALPQSPQIYKQLLMVAGMERYFQIARCFRDEDLRADRQPEFTQIDIEMSFVEEEDVWAIVEGLMQTIFKQTKNVDLDRFARMTYKEAMEMYGSDKPDTRFELFLNDISNVFTNTEFSVFKTILNEQGVINAIKVEDAADKFSRKDLDKLQDFVKVYKAKALSFLKYQNGEVTGSIAKAISEEEKATLMKQLDVKENDLLLIVADKYTVVKQSLGALRNKLAKDLQLIDEKKFNFMWITNFPMFEYVEEESRYVAAHHPFTAPNKEDIDKLLNDKGNCYSRAYDLVLNGYELLSGSIRIHDEETQKKVFEAIGLTMEQAQEKFGWFIDAFKYGAPPHGGVGIGLERLIMILADTDNIRDVVAFPKTASASDLMSEAPNVVDENQLSELGITIK